MTESPLKKRYPLHWAVYVDDVASLQELLDLRDDSMDIDQLDCRGRSPLMLAVTLGHKECAHVLLKMGANADSQNAQMWSVSHVATALKEASLLQEVIKYRDFQRSAKSAQSARKFLQMLADTSDFYCEMGWEFASWLPFVSKICPSDVYKIYKQGSRVRIDTTLLAFEGTTWKRGDQSFIFSLEDDVPLVVILDHTAKTASKQNLTDEEPIEHFTPTNYDVQQRSNGPTSTSYIDMDKIGFERSKTNGILSWISTSDRAETIDGHQCKVFDASNVHLVTKIRVDHLSPEQKTRLKQNQAESSHALQNILSFIRSENTEVIPAQDVHETGLTATEYLDADFPLNPDIGTVQEIQKKTNSFKATLWLAEGYPLDLQEQIMPIVELMASSSAHFARLQNFMRMQLPAGFPVKIEIPLFHLMSAKITFGKINDPNPFVTPLETTSNFKVKTVHIADEIFEIPANYRNIDEINWWPDDLGEQQHRAPRYPSAQDQDDMLLQIAIQQSLRESTASATDNFVLPGYYDTVDTDLAKAIEESLRVSGNAEAPMEQLEYRRVPVLSREDELSHALRVSKEENERSAREAAEAEDELQRVLALSLLEK